MNVLAISFRFHDDHDRNERYESFMKFFEGKLVWMETTSFILLKTQLAYNDVANSLFLTRFSAAKDKLLVIDVTNDYAAAWGNFQYKVALKGMLPNLIMV